MPNDVLSAALQRLTVGEDLAEDEARDVLLEIMGGRAGEAQTAAFLSALRVKGETAAACLPACPTRSRPRVTTPWSWTRRCRTCSSSAPGTLKAS